MQYWWVNHNQTARQEVEGQYLWSPKTESNGARSQFYNNMRLATPGDLVLSYAQQAVRYVGRVAEFAFTSPKPEEFGERGSYWNQEGWFLPVFWTPLAPPIRPKDLIRSIGPLLPRKYSPIHPVSGAGNQKAYLAAIPEAIFRTVVAGASFSQQALAHGGANSLTFEVVTDMLDEIVEGRVGADLTLSDTVRNSVILARRGQGQFRKNVERIEKSCRLTGITNPGLLIASHIKPWRLCSSADERLDGSNGLMLTPDADHLFDRGLISFEDSGAVTVSPRADRDDLRRLGFDHLAWAGVAEASASWDSRSFAPTQRNYLEYHRSQVFVA